MYRADIGVRVREKLAATLGVNKAPLNNIDMFVSRDFLGKAECEALIQMIEKDCKPSQLLSSNNPDANFRTSETCLLDRGNQVVQGVESKLTALLGIEPQHGEALQGQRYAVGQQFKPHHDYLRTTEAYWAKQGKIGGQRTWTAMVFLNVPENGGETYFPAVDLKIPPRAGSLLTWNNLNAEGEPNTNTLHQGTPVLAGVKYIITKWYRERPWGVSA